MDELARRRSPWWMREMPSKSLHGLAGKLMITFRTDGLSGAQHATLDSAIAELEYRRRRAPAPDKCSCWLCFGPFEEPELPFGEQY